MRYALTKAVDVTGREIMTLEQFESIPARRCKCGTILSKYNRRDSCSICRQATQNGEQTQ